MSQYLMVYLGGNHPASAEEGKQHFAKFMDAALSVARNCPLLEIGGSLKVSELMKMPVGN